MGRGGLWRRAGLGNWCTYGESFRLLVVLLMIPIADIHEMQACLPLIHAPGERLCVGFVGLFTSGGKPFGLLVIIV